MLQYYFIFYLVSAVVSSMPNVLQMHAKQKHLDKVVYILDTGTRVDLINRWCLHHKRQIPTTLYNFFNWCEIAF